MKMKVLFGWLIGSLALAGTALGATYADVATNYGAGWTNGANGGTGFGAWEISSGYVTGWAGCGIWNSTNAGLGMGEAFGFAGRGDGYIDLNRSFSQALNVNDSFEFDFGINYDSGSGNKGFNLYANGVQVINVNNAGSSALTINGSPALANYGTNTMHWTFTQAAADKIAVAATGRDGSETFSTTVTVASGYGYVGGLRFYAAGVSSDFQDQRQSYFNNLTLTQEGTPPPPPDTLTFTSGTWNPQAVGDYEFVLARTGAVGDEIVLTSSNTNAVTVPDSATFVSNSVAFNATVVSLTNGPATIVASNEATGAWANYVVTPVPPVLSLDGPRELFALGPATYTLQRIGAVGDTISLSSSAPGVLSVPATATFDAGETQKTFSATANSFGAARITATNVASGAGATFDVTVAAPALSIEGPATAWTGGERFYTVRRNSSAGVGADVNLSSTDTNVLTVPATVSFSGDALVAIIQATGVAPGSATIAADNDDVDPATFDVTVTNMPGVLAADHSGNYTPATFVNGANLGTGFGAWDFWNRDADLFDSTAGGGGDLNDTNAVAFRFMGDGAYGYCNARRNFAEALKPGDVFSFTFTYNWVGGNRGVDVYSGSQEKFANLINVGAGDAFSVNETVISREYTPGAVVYMEIAQKADGIEVYLTRAVGGTVNLAYTTNIVHGAGATSIAMYCGGYVADPIENNVNFAIFMNVLRIVGAEPTRLTFTGGTWNPAALGDYEFELTRSGAVTEEISLTSDNEAAVTVPATVNFVSNQVSFNATVVSLTAGNAKIVASNAATGATAEYNVYPVVPTLTIDGPFLVYGLGGVQYDLSRVGGVGDEIALSSSDTNVLTVVPTATFGAGTNETTFLATALAYGTATLYATDTVSGATADFTVTFQLQPNPQVETLTYNSGTRRMGFSLPPGYVLYAVYGADTAVSNQYWNFLPLSNGVDYVVTGTNVALITTNSLRKIIRIGFAAE